MPRVIVRPDKVVQFPAIQREEPPPPLAVDRVGEAHRRQVLEAAGQRSTVHVLLAVEPLQVAAAEGRVDLGVGRVEVHLVGVVQAVGVLRAS